MNVYDFDGTIYKGDSTIDFIIYSYLKHPFVLIRYLPKHISLFIKILISSHDNRTELKSAFFSFLKDIDNIESFVDLFGKKHCRKVQEWYLKQRKEDDLILTASPEFLVKSICKYNNISNVIGTKMDIHNGMIDGKNCKGEEKVRRFNDAYCDIKINEFYSDSLTDRYMASIAQKSFLVRKGKISQYYFEG